MGELSSKNPVRFSRHAQEQMRERGATRREVNQAIEEGGAFPAKRGRKSYRLNLCFRSTWSG